MTNLISHQFKFRFLVYPERGQYVGVCLDLNLVVERQSFEETINLLNDATVSHLLAAAEVGFPKELLSRPAPEAYWKAVVY